MDRISLGNRYAPARRSRQVAAGALCSASFAVGQLLFGQEPAPQFIFNPFAQPARAVQRADERASEAPPPRRADLQEEADLQEDEPRKIAVAAEPLPVNRLRPAAIKAIDEEQLPAAGLAPIVATTEAAPRQRAARKAEPLLIENTTFDLQDVAQASTRVEARPLPLDSADELASAEQADEAGLPPIVPASAMPRRPAKRQPAAEAGPASQAAPPRPASRPAARPAWMEDIRQSLSPMRRAPQSR
jgi:hypothetical protein